MVVIVIVIETDVSSNVALSSQGTPTRGFFHHRGVFPHTTPRRSLSGRRFGIERRERGRGTLVRKYIMEICISRSHFSLIVIICHIYSISCHVCLLYLSHYRTHRTFRGSEVLCRERKMSDRPGYVASAILRAT